MKTATSPATGARLVAMSPEDMHDIIQELPVEVIQKISTDCFAYQLSKINRLTVRFYNGNFKKHGLNVSMVSILVFVQLCEKVSIKELGCTLDIEHSAAFRLARGMIKKGFLNENKCSRDIYVSVTNKGKLALAAAYSDWELSQFQMQQYFHGNKIFNFLQKMMPIIEPKIKNR